MRRAAQAFNLMQSRLIRYIQDRDRILAAVSHDLKTPITRLRLRTELLEESPLREKFQAIFMRCSMAQASLDFLRGGETSEPLVALDLDALLESLREDAEDAGQELRHPSEAPAQPLRCRPLALKRCLTNLIDNALNNGNRPN